MYLLVRIKEPIFYPTTLTFGKVKSDIYKDCFKIISKHPGPDDVVKEKNNLQDPENHIVIKSW